MTQTQFSSKPATIRDVAKLAGVAPITVSKVLNNNGRISASTSEVVRQAAQTLNYRPNLSARGMKNRRSRLVGAVLQNVPGDHYAHPLAWEFVTGINDALEQKGYITSLVRLNDVLHDGEVLVNALQGHLLEGLIVVSDLPEGTDEKVQDMIENCIWLDANVWNPLWCIRRDEFDAGYTATQALLDAGYRKIFCVSVPESTRHYSAAERLKGIRQAAAAAAVVVEEVNSIELIDKPEVMKSLLQQLKTDVGLVVAEAYTVQRLSYEFMQSNLRPGHDFALACCDTGFHGNALEWPGLAHVAFERYWMGQHAAYMMIDRLQNPDMQCDSQLVRHPWVEGTTIKPCVN